MIIKGQKQRKVRISPFWISAIAILAMVLYSIISTEKKRDIYPASQILCNAEYVSDGLFISDSTTFQNGITRSEEKSYSGTSSSKLDKDNLYGMSYVLDNPPDNVRVIATIRRWTTNNEGSALAITTEPNEIGYAQSSKVISTSDDGWQLIEVELTLSKNTDINKLKVFPYQLDMEGVSYFDDMTISIEDLSDFSAYPLQSLHLYLDDKALNKINKKRKEALNIGILQTKDDDWVKAKLKANDDDYQNIELRLKGDWTDHLSGEYWSYRIKMPKDKSWNRIQTFSLQNPNTRSYLDEWIFHKLLEEVDVLTPRYGFIKLTQNNQDTVLYAYEEHFEKQIAEYKNRREGVIVKFTEDYLWSQRIRNKDLIQPNVFEDANYNSEVVPFGSKKTFTNPILTEQFLQAQKLMYDFKQKKNTAAEIFDIKLLAKYFAITAILDANHSNIWHNMRFYYNPITRKLEPIGFDGYTDSGPLNTFSKVFFGEYLSSDTDNDFKSFYQFIFKDPEFNKYYVPYLQNYSSESFITSFLDKYNPKIKAIERIIRFYTDSNYTYNRNKIESRTNLIYKNIQPYNDITIKAYRSSNILNEIDITNNHVVPLRIIGSGIDTIYDGTNNINKLINSNGYKSIANYTKINIPSHHKYVYYKLDGSKKIYHTHIRGWAYPGKLNLNISDKSKLQIPLDNNSYTDIDSVITIAPGNYTITKPIIIPESYGLHISEGTSINFTNQSYLLSYGDVQCIGTKDSPILLTSNDHSSQGVVVICANKTSHFSHTAIQNLKSLQENEWQLTGAITFYESEIKMNNVTIANNKSEDALNIIRSKFEINQLYIHHTMSDGFDSDFCNGSISNSYFHHTGNDGLDFSGSKVTVDNIRFENIGDKAISGGEEATLKVNNISIDNAIIGIASKDLSTVDAKDITLKNCNQGFAAYRKKPEFGGGMITVKNYELEKVKIITQADEESIIKLEK